MDNINKITKKIELLSPVGSLANLKAAVASGATSVYLGLNKFNAREYATNFNKDYLKEAVNICKSNNVKLYLTMNTLIKNNEIKDFFNELSYAYTCGIDSVIIQEISFLPIIKKQFPDLNVHISTQAGVMNSYHANLLNLADRINLARELNKENIKTIRKNFPKQLEIFIHGALCSCVSGSCLFSSFLGQRSGNRGKCAQPCRKKYNGSYQLSTKELCLIKRIPEIIELGINSIKIEGRMRTPYYVATTTKAYHDAIESYYNNTFNITPDIIKKLETAYSREFTEGKYSSENIFNTKSPQGSSVIDKQTYEVNTKDIKINRKFVQVKLPEFKEKNSQKKQLLVKVYNKKDAISASNSGADIIYYDIFSKDFNEVKQSIKCKLYAYTPRIMFDSDIQLILKEINSKKPDGILAGNLGILKLNLGLPIHLDYNINCFNDIDLKYYEEVGVFPIISPELSIDELKQFKNKNFSVLVHGKIILMTLAHQMKETFLKDEKGFTFKINSIRNGSEVVNEKELGLFNKAKNLSRDGITSFYIDSDKDISTVVDIYRKILDGKTIDVSSIKNDYVLGWSNKPVL